MICRLFLTSLLSYTWNSESLLQSRNLSLSWSQDFWLHSLEVWSFSRKKTHIPQCLVVTCIYLPSAHLNGHIWRGRWDTVYKLRTYLSVQNPLYLALSDSLSLPHLARWSPNPTWKETFSPWLTPTPHWAEIAAVFYAEPQPREQSVPTNNSTVVGAQICSLLQKDKLCVIKKVGAFCNEEALRKKMHKQSNKIIIKNVFLFW